MVLGLADVDVSSEPVDSQTTDLPRRQELHLRRRLPAERVDDRVSTERPRVRCVGTRLGPVDDTGHSIIVHRAATDTAVRRTDQRPANMWEREPRGNVPGDTT